MIQETTTPNRPTHRGHLCRSAAYLSRHDGFVLTMLHSFRGRHRQGELWAFWFLSINVWPYLTDFLTTVHVSTSQLYTQCIIQCGFPFNNSYFHSKWHTLLARGIKLHTALSMEGHDRQQRRGDIKKTVGYFLPWPHSFTFVRRNVSVCLYSRRNDKSRAQTGLHFSRQITRTGDGILPKLFK